MITVAINHINTQESTHTIGGITNSAGGGDNFQKNKTRKKNKRTKKKPKTQTRRNRINRRNLKSKRSVKKGKRFRKNQKDPEI